MQILKRLLSIGLIVYLPILAPAAAAEDYVGKVNHVFDPATIRIAYKGGQIRVRMVDIEAPNTSQAKLALSHLLLGKQVQVKAIRWQGGYLIGQVFLNGRGVSTDLVRKRYAEASGAHTPTLDGS